MRKYVAHRGLVILTLAAAMSLGAIVQIAFADHWHIYHNHWHGLVHGESTSDGSFFGRTEGYNIGDINYCYVGDTDNGINYGTVTYNADLCSVWTWAYYVAINECRGATVNAVDGANPVSFHNHYAHNYGGYCKVYRV